MTVNILQKFIFTETLTIRSNKCQVTWWHIKEYTQAPNKLGNPLILATGGWPRSSIDGLASRMQASTIIAIKARK